MAILEAILVHTNLHLGSAHHPAPRRIPDRLDYLRLGRGYWSQGELGTYLETEKMPGDLFPVQSG